MSIRDIRGLRLTRGRWPRHGVDEELQRAVVAERRIQRPRDEPGVGRYEAAERRDAGPEDIHPLDPNLW